MESKETVEVLIVRIQAPEKITKVNIERVITECWRKWNNLHIHLGGDGLLIHHVKNAYGQYVRFENRQCADRSQHGFEIEFAPKNIDNESAIIDAMIQHHKEDISDQGE